jgi:hypothetical protein
LEVIFMKLFKSLLLSLSILTFAQVPSAQAMELGCDALQYVAQDMYEQIPEYIINGVIITGVATSIASALYVSYCMEKAANAASKAAGNFFQVALSPLTVLENAAKKTEAILTHKDVIKVLEARTHSKK